MSEQFTLIARVGGASLWRVDTGGDLNRHMPRLDGVFGVYRWTLHRADTGNWLHRPLEVTRRGARIQREARQRLPAPAVRALGRALFFDAARHVAVVATTPNNGILVRYPGGRLGMIGHHKAGYKRLHLDADEHCTMIGARDAFVPRMFNHRIACLDDEPLLA